MPGGAVTHDSTMVETTRVVSRLRWATGRIFDVLGVWASEADRTAIAVSMAASSRHLGWHAADLDELLPEDAPEETDQPRPSPYPDLDAILEIIGAMPGSVERLAVANRVLLVRLAAGCVAIERMIPPQSDDPVTAVIGFLLADLRRDRDDGELLLERLVTDVDAVDRVGERVIDAERRLVAVGGLFPDTIG